MFYKETKKERDRSSIDPEHFKNPSDLESILRFMLTLYRQDLAAAIFKQYSWFQVAESSGTYYTWPDRVLPKPCPLAMVV